MIENEELVVEQIIKRNISAGENSHERSGIAFDLKDQISDIIDRVEAEVNEISKFNGVDSY